MKIRLTNAKKPERSYLTGCTDGGKLHLIVEVSQVRCPQYKIVIQKIKEALEKDSLTKKEAMEMRETLCSNYGC